MEFLSFEQTFFEKKVDFNLKSSKKRTYSSSPERALQIGVKRLNDLKI